MAKALELDLKEINLLKWSQVKQGFIEMEEEQVKIFEEYHWKLFVSMIGYKMVEKYRDVITGECLIIFFPSDLEEFNEVMNSQNTTFMGQQLVRPLFYIKFDKDSHIEFIDRSENKIPKKILFMILCR